MRGELSVLQIDRHGEAMPAALTQQLAHAGWRRALDFGAPWLRPQ